MAETKRPDDSQMPFKEVVRRTMVHQKRAELDRHAKACQTEKEKLPESMGRTTERLPWEEIKRRVLVHLARLDLDRRQQARNKEIAYVKHELARIEAERTRRRITEQTLLEVSKP